MNINWGWKIVIAFVIFFVVMGSLVYKSATEDHQLVAQNYYEQEMLYQEVIDQKKSAKEQGVLWQEKEGKLCLLNPRSQALEGKILLYRASNKEWDQSITYSIDKTCLSATDFQKGKWKVIFKGKLEDEKIYTEYTWIVW